MSYLLYHTSTDMYYLFYRPGPVQPASYSQQSPSQPSASQPASTLLCEHGDRQCS